MTDQTEDTGEDFATFEANLANPPAEKPEDDDTLELTDKVEEPEVEDEEGEDEEHGKKRSKPAHLRINEITAARRAAERERDEALAELARLRGGQPEQKAETAAKPDPNDEKYEYGEADPQYAADLIEWTVEQRLAAREAEKAQTAQQEATVAELSSLDESWTETVEKATEKYPDFKEVVVDGADSWECPPIVAIGIQTSEVGADVAYTLAKDPVKAAAIAATLEVNPALAAQEFGELEGQHLDKLPKRPPAGSHPLDMARYAGQVRGFANKPAKEAAPEPNRITKAPEPPRHSLKGAGGRFEVDDDTPDFAAFERKIMGGKR